MIVDLNHDEARCLRLKLLVAIADLKRPGVALSPNHEGQLAFLKALLDKLTKKPT